jgi:hypothetical protein
MSITEIPIIWILVFFVLLGMSLEICEYNPKSTKVIFFLLPASRSSSR